MAKFVATYARRKSVEDSIKLNLLRMQLMQQLQTPAMASRMNHLSSEIIFTSIKIKKECVF